MEGIHLISIRIHGRGGQGAKMSAKIIARTAYLQGYKTQDFAMYGAERQGAPITSFVRLDKEKISERGHIFEPDYILILDDSIDSKTTLEGLRKDTIVLVNTQKKIEKKNFVAFDATSIALQKLGKPIANIALLGAFVSLVEFLSIESLVKAIPLELKKASKIVKANIDAAKECYRLMDAIK